MGDLKLQIAAFGFLVARPVRAYPPNGLTARATRRGGTALRHALRGLDFRFQTFGDGSMRAWWRLDVRMVVAVLDCGSHLPLSHGSRAIKAAEGRRSPKSRFVAGGGDPGSSLGVQPSGCHRTR